MSNATINIEIFDDSIGDEWNNVEAAAESYAEFLEQRLIARCAEANIDADVRVTFRPNMAGCAPRFIWADDQDTEETLQSIVDNYSDQDWMAFCESDAARTL